MCCPLCTQVIGNEYHLIFGCPVVTSLWSQIEPLLLKIHPASVTEQEMIFGILGNSPTITLRNWLTYCLRFCICQQEVLAYHNKQGLLNELNIKLIYNSRVHREAVQPINITQSMRLLSPNNFRLCLSSPFNPPPCVPFPPWHPLSPRYPYPTLRTGWPQSRHPPPQFFTPSCTPHAHLMFFYMFVV